MPLAERSFWSRWKPAWGIKKKRLNFDLHRAFSLWTWAMLFVLAWSSVAFDLHDEVYCPITKALFGMNEAPQREALKVDQGEPGMSWREAHRIGRVLMAKEIAASGLPAVREDSIYYDPHRAEFTYWMTTRVNEKNEANQWIGVSFDANTGVLRHVDSPGAEQTGDFITRWLYDLHMANVWGLPYRIFVCVMGMVVTMLTVTGLVIWWRKRRVRVGSAIKRRAAAAEPAADPSTNACPTTLQDA